MLHAKRVDDGPRPLTADDTDDADIILIDPRYRRDLRLTGLA